MFDPRSPLPAPPFLIGTDFHITSAVVIGYKLGDNQRADLLEKGVKVMPYFDAERLKEMFRPEAIEGPSRRGRLQRPKVVLPDVICLSMSLREDEKKKAIASFGSRVVVTQNPDDLVVMLLERRPGGGILDIGLA